jgi:predicted pyridoxine 5'-phosphate oxidase superfamily flavin-nucleotide-binding protein
MQRIPSSLPGTHSTGERLLQERHGTRQRAERFYADQVLDHLNGPMREFVGRQEMFFLASSDGGGACDSTFRAGPAGFVQVLDERRLAWAEYRGNGVMASLGNITENPHVGLLFIDFFRDVIGLHVNGLADTDDDTAMRASHPQLSIEAVPGRHPQRWITVYVQEAYIHCAKHIPRLRKSPPGRACPADGSAGKKTDFFAARSTTSAP